ncbi:MAG: hypothetical protein LBL34_01390 [Clostridiales bacterium]|jgi:hypothetical protein|nr:hypothetical protein [Clostridiales bacterium]
MTSKLLDLGRELYRLKQQKEELQAEEKELNETIRRIESMLISEMTENELSEFKDKEILKRFSLMTKTAPKQSAYAQENDVEFAETFKEHGKDIFKFSCHQATFAAMVNNELLETDELGNYKLPEWAEPFVEISEYQKIYIK